MSIPDHTQTERSPACEPGMSTHPILMHLRAANSDPNRTTLAQLKAHGWFTPLWMEGSSTTDSNGQIAMGFRASVFEGGERPVLLTYVDEAQARQEHPDTSLMSNSLGVLGLLAHQQAIDLAVLDGEDGVMLDHSQFLGLRNYMTAEADLEYRSAKDDEKFMTRLNTFMLEACRYCKQQLDIRNLHLAAMAMGGAPMRAILLLDANNALIHENYLETMYKQHMLPGDGFMALDRLDPMEQEWLQELCKLEPVYTQQKSSGWWAHLIGRWNRPRLAVLMVSMSPDAVST